MKRRQVLSVVGGLGTAAVAGCLEGAGSPGDDPGGSDGTPSPQPVLAKKSFTVTGSESGQKTQNAEVTFDDVVRITGTITGQNGCYVAKLAEVSVRKGALAVTVEAVEDKEDGQMCTQALVEIDYEATFEFEGTLPGSVVVKHDSMGEVETVTETQR